MNPIVLGVLASTRGTDLQAIIDAIEEKKLNARIAVVISDKQEAFALKRARKHGIEALFLDPKGFNSREEFDEKIAEELEKRGVELICLIGYMKILSKKFIQRFENKIMNVHPSLLPAFAGGMDKNVHQAVLDSGVKVSGMTIHFVNEQTDAGPIILQKTVKVEENETIDSLKEKVQAQEKRGWIEAIKLFQEEKIKVEKGKVKILK